MYELLPKTGYVRLPVVLNVFPVSKSTWWAGIKSGKYPRGVKLSARVTAWKVEEIRALIEGVPLPMIAVDLAEASDQIRTAVKSFRKTGKNLKYREGPERMILAKSIHPLLAGTLEKVDRSVKACRAASLDLQKYSHGNIHINSPIVAK